MIRRVSIDHRQFAEAEMRKVPQSRRCVLALAAFALALGCKEGPKGALPVTGKVNYKGMPLAGGTIVFTPDASHGNSGDIALGEIHLDGTYTLRTGKNSGVAPGWYRVTVAALSTQGVALPGQPYSIPQSLLPERYRDPEQSNLACEIKPDRSNVIDFNLD
jgi:hypothetical protein